MRLVAALVIVLGLVAGLVGTFAAGQLSGKAGAATGQQREDQITITPGQGRLGNAEYGPPEGYGTLQASINQVVLDPADYPPSASFRLEVLMHSPGSTHTKCTRLFDVTGSSAIEESEVCSQASEPDRVRSQPFTLPSGEHVYTLEVRGACSDCQLNLLYASRVIVEWTEASPAVGGIVTLLPGVSDSGGYNYAAMAGLVAAALVVVTAGAWVTRKRWERS